MKQTAIIKSVSDGVAVVEVSRVSSCASCPQHGGCVVCKKKITAEALNDIGALPGDMVTIESPSASILGYAAAVFVVPLLAGFVSYAILLNFRVDAVFLYCAPAALFAALFTAICLILNRSAEKKGKIIVTEIITDKNYGVSGDRSGL